MLGLIGANAVAVILFGILYTVAGAEWLSQGAFLACLVVLFALLTVLWLRAEGAQGRHRDALARFGRIAFGLLVVVLATPPAVLMPIFWLETQLSADAGLLPVVRGLMVVVLIALTLTALMNVVGGLALAVRGVTGRHRAARARDGVG
jgi:hypothetical protein